MLQRSAFNSTHEPTAPVSRSRFRLHARRYSQNESATAGSPDARNKLARTLIFLRKHGIRPTPLAILCAVTDSGADEELTAEIAAIISLKGKHHARASAGVSLRG